MRKSLKEIKDIINEHPEMMEAIKQIGEKGIAEPPNVEPLNGPVELDWSLYPKIKNSKQK
jgi:hypothetical protein